MTIQQADRDGRKANWVDHNEHGCKGKEKNFNHGLLLNGIVERFNPFHISDDLPKKQFTASSRAIPKP